MIAKLLTSFIFLPFFILFLFCEFYYNFREGSLARSSLLRTSIGSLFYLEQKIGLIFAFWGMGDVFPCFSEPSPIYLFLSHSCLSNMALVLPSPWKVLTTSKCAVWFLTSMRVLVSNSSSDKPMLLPILVSHWHFALIAWFLFYFSLLLHEMLYISFTHLVYCWSPSLKHKLHKGRNSIVLFTPMTPEQSMEHS